MAKVSGINVSSIVKINTTDATLISYISGINTSTIPGWPTSGTGPTLLSASTWISNGANNPNESAIAISATSGSWSMNGTGSYIYKWYVDGTLVNTQYSPVFQPGKPGFPDEWIFNNPSLGTSVTASYLFTSMSLQITASDNNGTAYTSIDTYVNDILYETYISNTGITGSTEIAALQYLQRELRAGGHIEVLADYYPLVGNNETQQKWSMRNPNEYLDFSSGWTFNKSGSTANGTSAYATSSITYDFVAPGVGFYSGKTLSFPPSYSFDIGLKGSDNIYTVSVLSRVTGSIPTYYSTPAGTYGSAPITALSGSKPVYRLQIQYNDVNYFTSLYDFKNENTGPGWYGALFDVDNGNQQTKRYNFLITGSITDEIYPNTRFAAPDAYGSGKKLVIGAAFNDVNRAHYTGSSYPATWVDNETWAYSNKLYQFIFVEQGIKYRWEDLKTIFNTFNTMLGR